MATTLDALVAELPEDLIPTRELPRPARVIAGVHISELLDPTPFLSGGELLLTTGMGLTHQVTPLTGYVTRLTQAGVIALGFGVGPVHAQVPEALCAAAERAALPLLVVPARTPFQAIVTRFFANEQRAENAELTGALGATHALVRAATHGDPLRDRARIRVVRVLCGAVGGWAAHLDSAGRPDAVWPRSAATSARAAGAEVARIRAAGARAGATFPLGSDDVLLQPAGIADGGYIACGHPRPIPGQMRHLTLAACAVLDLAAERMSDTVILQMAGPAVVGNLLALGQLDAATAYARAHVGGWPATVRVGCAVASPGVARDELARHSARDRMTWVWPAEDASQAWARLTRAAQGRGVLGPVIPAARVVAELERVAAQAMSLAPGDWVDLGHSAHGLEAGDAQRCEAALRALTQYRRADLVATATAYLAHRGHIEGTAGQLGVHRNTVRHRLALIERVGDIDIDDPDVAAHLWLALRRTSSA